MYLDCIDLTLITLLDIFEAIRLHSQPIIPYSEIFLSHGVPIGVSSKGSFVNFFDKHVCSVSIQASELDYIVVSFVEHITIEEELGCQSSECFLILT